MIDLKFDFTHDKKSGKGATFAAVLAVLGVILAGLGLAALVAFALGWAVALLWNWLMPAIFGLPVITYWQGVGMLVLAHILLKGHASHDRKDAKAPKEIDRDELAKDVAARVKALLDAERAQPKLPEAPPAPQA